MNRVFVVHNPLRWDSQRACLMPKHDVSAARQFGRELINLYPSDQPILMDDAEHVVDHFRKVLDDFDDKDFLLLIGNPVLIGYAVALAAAANDGQVQMLVWQNNAYRVTSANLPVMLLEP